MYVCSGAIVPARPTAPGRALHEITRSCLDKNSGKLNSTFPRITVQQRAQHCCGAPPAVTAAARLQPMYYRLGIVQAVQ